MAQEFTTFTPIENFTTFTPVEEAVPHERVTPQRQRENNQDSQAILAREARDFAEKVQQAIASKDPVAIGTSLEDLKAANRNLVRAGGEAVPIPDLYPAKPPETPSPAASAAPAADSGGTALDDIPMTAQRLMTGIAGGGIGASTGAFPAGYKAWAAKKAFDKIFPDRVEPTIDPAKSVVVEQTSSPWRPNPNAQVANPAAVNAEGVSYGETPYQRELNQQNAAAQRAARTNTAASNLSKIGINPDVPLAQYGDIRTTRGGVLVDKPTEAKIQNAEELAAANERQRKINVANEAGGTWQELMKKGEQLAASADVESQKLGNVLKQKALEWWKTGAAPLQNWAGKLGTVGFTTGFAVPGAVEKMQAGNVPGGLQELGTGAAVGAALTAVPQRAALPLNAGLQGMDSMARAAKGDYLGSGLSAFGALAPWMIPFAVAAPEVAVPAALAAGVLPPTINMARDYVNRLRSQRQGALPTQPSQ